MIRRPKLAHLFCKGFRADHIKGKPPSDATVVVVFGLKHGGAKMFRYCREKNIPVIYIDNAYFYYRQRFNGSPLYRVSVNAQHVNFVMDDGLSQERIKHFRLKMKPWKMERGKSIMVCPPPKTVADFYGLKNNWKDETIVRLCDVTDRPIFVRQKPPYVDFDITSNQREIAAQLKDTWCVVSYTSGIAVTAAMAGIPVSVEPHSPAAPVSTPFQQIETPLMPDRDKWLRTLVHHTFSVREFENGSVWDFIQRHYAI